MISTHPSLVSIAVNTTGPKKGSTTVKLRTAGTTSYES